VAEQASSVTARVGDLAPSISPAVAGADGDVTILARDVHVVYRVYEQRRTTMRELFAQRRGGRKYRAIHAVRGVSFTARAGETIGVIGPNGAGKSSLLSAIAGLLPVTSGEVWAHSNPSFLGVGAALKPQLSGRHNVYLGCLALGMTKREVDEHIDEIIDFADVREFIDVPLRAYSSGMRARLQFAIATSVRPEILLIDEALGVGDRRMRRRSDRRIRNISSHAGTVMLVSHSLPEIRRQCSRVIWLDHGEVVADGPPDETVNAYIEAQDRDDDVAGSAGPAGPPAADDVDDLDAG
jgi:teichoic acid transport system ATP-binding protein